MEFFSYLAAILLIYYCCIILYFYRIEIKAVLKAKMSRSPSKKSGNSFTMATSPDSTFLNTDEPSSTLNNLVHELIADCEQVFNVAANQQLDKQQAIDALRLCLLQYPQIKGSVFQIAVTNHIVGELQCRLAITLTDLEANQLW